MDEENRIQEKIAKREEENAEKLKRSKENQLKDKNEKKDLALKFLNEGMANDVNGDFLSGEILDCLTEQYINPERLDEILKRIKSNPDKNIFNQDKFNSISSIKMLELFENIQKKEVEKKLRKNNPIFFKQIDLMGEEIYNKYIAECGVEASYNTTYSQNETKQLVKIDNLDNYKFFAEMLINSFIHEEALNASKNSIKKNPQKFFRVKKNDIVINFKDNKDLAAAIKESLERISNDENKEETLRVIKYSGSGNSGHFTSVVYKISKNKIKCYPYNSLSSSTYIHEGSIRNDLKIPENVEIEVVKTKHSMQVNNTCLLHSIYNAFAPKPEETNFYKETIHSRSKAVVFGALMILKEKDYLKKFKKLRRFIA